MTPADAQQIMASGRLVETLPGVSAARTTRYRRVVELRGQGMTLAAIGAEMDVSPSRVHDLLRHVPALLARPATYLERRTAWQEARRQANRVGKQRYEAAQQAERDRYRVAFCHRHGYAYNGQPCPYCVGDGAGLTAP